MSERYGGLYYIVTRLVIRLTFDVISVLDEVLVPEEGAGLLRDVNHPGSAGALHLVGEVHVVAPNVELEPEFK